MSNTIIRLMRKYDFKCLKDHSQANYDVSTLFWTVFQATFEIVSKSSGDK